MWNSSFSLVTGAWSFKSICSWNWNWRAATSRCCWCKQTSIPYFHLIKIMILFNSKLFLSELLYQQSYYSLFSIICLGFEVSSFLFSDMNRFQSVTRHLLTVRHYYFIWILWLTIIIRCWFNSAGYCSWKI